MTRCILDYIPPELLSQAYQWRQEYAWSKEACIQVLQHLQQQCISILGIEVWIPSTSGPVIPSPIMYTWTASSRNKNEDMTAWAARTCASARDYVRHFQWDTQDTTCSRYTPYFCIVPDI